LLGAIKTGYEILFHITVIWISSFSREMGMSESLFARLDCPDATVCLDVQYRMNEAITNIANALTYNGQLKCGNKQVSTATLQLPALHVSNVQHHE
jgi:DNA replication ATP-dependent helicase Dna2